MKTIGCLSLLISYCMIIEGIESCSDDSECEEGSQCRSGRCSRNPFESGCLQKILPEWTGGLRVCNSDDPPNAAESGICRVPEFDYMEIRIESQTWESPILEAWILQIVLSEILGVPTTVETGRAEVNLNFYDVDATFNYGINNDATSMQRASELRDCRLANRDPDSYEPCAHFVPEIWASTLGEVQQFVTDGIAEPPQALGVLAGEAWYMTKFTAVNDSTLATYFGLQGDANRQKLAGTFLRPTTWKDYCDLVSSNGCQTSDEVAVRAPETQEENQRMFVDGLYTGHFRKTEKNDCTKNPTNCTGHIADYPCGWVSSVEKQAYHLNIALESDGTDSTDNGYTYSQLMEMWQAANVTKSNLMMMWWTPEPLYQRFQGSDAEFQRVTLPTPTHQCAEARAKNVYHRCAPLDFNDRIGVPAESCDYEMQSLHKVAIATLFDTINDESIPEEIRSPAYEALKLFRLSQLQLGHLFAEWASKGSPRQAVCEWLANDEDYLQALIPRTYPRVLREGEIQWALMMSSIILGSVATVIVLITGFLVFRRRKQRVMKVAQVEFLLILIGGLLLISAGAIVGGLSATDGSCLATTWLINSGYTLELVPLIIKVAAINRLMNAAQQLKRVKLRRENLFGGVILLCAAIVVYLTVWSVLDPPRKTPEYGVNGSMERPDVVGSSTVVTVHYYCSSDSGFWKYIEVLWNSILLFCATILAFQMRRIRQDFNESQTLAMMIYSHFVFVCSRLVTFGLSSSVSGSVLARCRSLIYSVDTILTIFIYFVPKLIADPLENNSSSALFSWPSPRLSNLAFQGCDDDRSVLAIPSKQDICNERSRGANGDGNSVSRPSASLQKPHVG